MPYDALQEGKREVADTFILMSGGVDSMVCAHLMKNRGYRAQGIFVDYGQPAARYEQRAAEAVSEHFGLFPLLSISTRGASAIRGGEIPGRNAFLIFSAMTLAGVNSGFLAIGVHSGTEYYDCTLAFLRGAGEIVSSYTDGKLRLIAPLQDWRKPDILAFATEKDLPLELTYSCEFGVSPPCGECLSCKDRRRMGC